MPKISVIVPVYRAEAYLKTCVDSILSQTFADLEVFLVDDGSPDSCGTICDEYTQKDDRVRVIHQQNQGQAAARNHAISQAKGEWFCFVDSDDLIHPQMVELLYSAVEQSGADIALCRMLEAPELPQDFMHPRELAFEAVEMNEETLVRLHDREEYPAWVACDKLVRANLVKQYLFTQGRVFEDNEAVCHWVCGAKRLARMDQELYFYRTNPESTTQSTFSVKKLDYLWALEQIITFYDSIGYLQMKARFADRYAQALVNSVNGLRYSLHRPELVPDVERQAARFIRKQKLNLTLEQKEALLDVMHPKLIRFYWPVAGAVKTVKKTGFRGLVHKIKKNLTGGTGQ